MKHKALKTCSAKSRLFARYLYLSMSNDSRRLSILTTQEIEDIYAFPQFTEYDRHIFFDLSPAEYNLVDSIHTFSVAAHLILQIGYFKAKHLFFVYAFEAVVNDLEHIRRRYFPMRSITEIKTLSKPTRLEQQQIILKLFGYHLCDSTEKVKLERKAQRVAMLSTQPIFILRESLQYMTQQRIVAPGYTYLQDMVGKIVSGERQRITHLLSQELTLEVNQQLEALLTADEGMYRISILKHEPKDFSYGELRQEVWRRKFFHSLYEFGKSFFALAGLSNDSVKYYASLVQFYTVYKLQRMAIVTTNLYLLCFAYHRFRQINDNLIDAFIHLVNQYEKQAKLAAESSITKALTEANSSLEAAGQVLNLFTDPSIPNDTPFLEIKQQAFALLEPEHFALVSHYMRNIEFDKTAFEWSYYGTLQHKFKLNLRHLFCNLDFEGLVNDAPVLNAIAFLQELLRQGKSPRQADILDFPVSIITKGLQRYMYTTTGKRKDKRLEVDRYEFLVYHLLRNALEAGNIYVKDSNDFRSFEDDLISTERWENKDAILRDIGAPILLTPIQETLATFRKELEAKFQRVNERIENGDNRHIKVRDVKNERRWSLIYPTEEESTNSPFYGQLPSIGITDLLFFVAKETDFSSAFTNVLERYVKQEADSRLILACIIAMGTNMGLWKMSEVSGLNYSSLLTTSRNFLRAETLHDGNDKISNATAGLSMFSQYDIGSLKHSSSDGQRIETQINTINARHASKYYGLKKGISAYTLISNHVPCNAKIIGTHEHESHYVFDILHNNSSDIKPERHSTDTHGTNHVNHIILFTFGYQFAPRYRDLHKVMTSLVGFNSLGHYDHYLIKPSRKTSDMLIIKEWPNIQRILASLAQKDVTQATVVRKLSSYARQNQTKKALWELDSICRTNHILDFIDNVELRKSVQKALNRGEAYHRMRRAISYVNSGKFRVKTETEQQIWNECSRLIANAIIYYNTLLLSRVYQQKLAYADEEAIQVLKRTSPVAWRNINLFGTFDFSTGTPTVDIEALAANFNDEDFWKRSLYEDTKGSGNG